MSEKPRIGVEEDALSGAPTVVPPRLEEQAPTLWGPIPPSRPPDASITELADATPPTPRPRSQPASPSAEQQDSRALRKTRDTVLEQIVRLPLEQLAYCSPELDALHAVLTQRWRGLLREALEWARVELLSADRSRTERPSLPVTIPTGSDVVARVRQNAWRFAVEVPMGLRAEWVDEVLPRLRDAAEMADRSALTAQEAAQLIERRLVVSVKPDRPEADPRHTPPSRRTRRR